MLRYADPLWEVPTMNDATGLGMASNVTPVPLMQLITGFWAAKTLAVAVELDLFSRLDKAGGAGS